MIIILLLSFSGQAREQYTLETIKKVISADTFLLESGKRIRLIGIDAPEDEPNRKSREDAERWGKIPGEIIAMGKAATEWAEVRLQGKDIFLKYDKRKNDGRGYDWVYAFLYDENLFYGGIVERVTFEDVFFEWNQVYERGGYIFLNATIVKGGYAHPVRNLPNTKHQDQIEEGYAYAKENFEGLFNVDFFQVPCTETGERIGDCAGCIIRCCKPSEPIFDLVVDGKCRRNPIPGSGGYCSYCGNNICDSEYLEDECNCPKDCN